LLLNKLNYGDFPAPKGQVGRSNRLRDAIFNKGLT
jgi:hypothetical protein